MHSRLIFEVPRAPTRWPHKTNLPSILYPQLSCERSTARFFVSSKPHSLGQFPSSAARSLRIDTNLSVAQPSTHDECESAGVHTGSRPISVWLKSSHFDICGNLSP